MKFRPVSGMLCFFALAAVSLARAGSDADTHASIRPLLAVKYVAEKKTSVEMVGTPSARGAVGKAEVEFKRGRSEVTLEMYHIGHPQSHGAPYTTFVLWAIAPDGKPDNITELPDDNHFRIEATTPLQTFGLLITAEPYPAVSQPGPAIVAENALKKGADPTIETSRIEYRTMSVLTMPGAPPKADRKTPAIVLSARRAVEAARQAAAGRYAPAELSDASTKLSTLEEAWAITVKEHSQPTFDRKFRPMADEVMRLGERARELAIERTREAEVEAERVSAVVDVAAARSEAAEARQAAQAASAAAVQIESNARQAQVQADSARSDAQQARGQADTARSQAEQAQIDASEARSREEEARAEALEARANEAAARAEADEARLQAEQARHDAEMMRQALDASVAQILEARREARGLIVNISDVLFDFNEATLTPGAKSRIQKLAEILTSYAGPYHVDIEGHTDSAGPDDINLRLSEARAQSVRTALLAAGIPSERVGPAHGVGKDTPVATNGTATGRQFNRRVEIIVGDGNK